MCIVIASLVNNFRKNIINYFLINSIYYKTQTIFKYIEFF
jgi:hypothetical protein